jgi:hypothetical protein
MDMNELIKIANEISQSTARIEVNQENALQALSSIAFNTSFIELRRGKAMNIFNRVAKLTGDDRRIERQPGLDTVYGFANAQS